MAEKPAYRWNTDAFAEGYDQAAEAIHPYYRAIQDQILASLPEIPEGGWVVDLGGGSGRLMERMLERQPAARGLVVDQSEPFLALAERRLEKFGPRARCLQIRLQDNWRALLPGPALAIVSMSAIHHLEPREKQALYRQCFEALASGGVLLNGDEVCDAESSAYHRGLSVWAEHMRQGLASGAIPPIFRQAAENWIDRNVTRFGEPKQSGDDCHETIAAQLAYFREAGFAAADCPWQAGMWAVLRGRT